MVVDKPIFDLTQLKSESESRILDWMQCWIPGKPLATSTSLSYSGNVGSGTEIFYSFVSWLGKEGWEVIKIDEWIEVSPTHAQYYQLTQAQKSTLEEKIRVGLNTAAQLVGEYEMLLHDLRKYREIVDAMEKKDEHRLRAIFVDQVDIHTGEGVSLRSIVARWPTVIYDFMKLGEEENPDEIADKLGISKAEAVILATKNKLYKTWREIFGKEVKNRYTRILVLANSKKKMIEEYRNWLKPYIARYKSIKLGTEAREYRKSMIFSPFEITGQATFSNGIKLWAWQSVKVFELGMVEVELPKEIPIPYDPFIRDALLFGKVIKVKPLSAIYPFLLDRIPEREAKELEVVKNGIVPVTDARTGDKLADDVVKMWKKGKMGLDSSTPFYEFMEVDVSRSGLKVPGGEFEDISFDIRVYFVTQNVLLLKLVEMMCREREFEKYLDEIIGIEEEKEIGKKTTKEVKEAPKVRFTVRIPKRGPYISQFEQIESNFFPKVMGDFDDVRNFLFEKFGIG